MFIQDLEALSTNRPLMILLPLVGALLITDMFERHSFIATCGAEQGNVIPDVLHTLIGRASRWERM
jgi:hypothetical protein